MTRRGPRRWRGQLDAVIRRWARCWSRRGRRGERRRVTAERFIVGKLHVNLGAANVAPIVSNTAVGGITVNGNPPASQQVSWRWASSSDMATGGATVSIPGSVGTLGIESLAVV